MKKGLSILLVLTLLASMLVPFPVHATAGNTLPNAVTVGGTGGITTMGTFGDILGGSLPTAANLHFTIDPRNLLEVDLNAVIDLDARNTAVDFGANNVLQAWSTSSIETLLTVSLSVNANGANAVLTEVAITNGDVATENNVLMWMEPSASYRNAEDAPFVGLGQVVPYGTSPVPVQFRLQAIPHDVVKTGVTEGVVTVGLQAAANAPAQFGTAFSFGGIINAESEKWGDVTALGVSAVFTMERATGAAATAAFRTDGDVTAASRMLAGHAGPDVYTAPTLIALPAGGASGGNQEPAVGFLVEGVRRLAHTVPGTIGNVWTPEIPIYLGDSTVDTIEWVGFPVLAFGAAGVDTWFYVNTARTVLQVVAEADVVLNIKLSCGEVLVLTLS